MTLQGEKCECFGTSATSGENIYSFFFHHHIKMASTSYNAGDVLQLLEEDGSEFFLVERKEMRSTLTVDLSAPMNQNTAALTPKLDRNICDHGKLIF